MRRIVILAALAGGAGLFGCSNGALTTPNQGQGGTVGGGGGEVGSPAGSPAGSPGGSPGGSPAGGAGAGGRFRGGGAAGSAGAGGRFRGDGAAGAGGAVVPQDAGVCPSSGAAAVIPWHLLMPDAGTAGLPARDAGTGSSGCARTVNGTQTNIACAGDAWLRVDTQHPSIVWGDGAQLVWDTGGSERAISPPAAAPGPQRVWASLTEDYRVLCPVCGAVSTVAIQVRESAGGKLLFLSHSGYDGEDPTSDQLMALFGVDADSQTICTFPTQDGCVLVLLTLTQHVLRTTVAQVIPSATRTTVSTPNGMFEVSWYSSFEKNTGQSQTCLDGAPRGALMHFVASRVSLPAP